jgi:pre-mRNA-splicing regulator WTAP
VVSYLSNLKSSEESLKEQVSTLFAPYVFRGKAGAIDLMCLLSVLHTQLEKAKKREAAFIVTFAKREQEIAELKVPFGSLHYTMRNTSLWINLLNILSFF